MFFYFVCFQVNLQNYCNHVFFFILSHYLFAAAQLSLLKHIVQLTLLNFKSVCRKHFTFVIHVTFIALLPEFDAKTLLFSIWPFISIFWMAISKMFIAGSDDSSSSHYNLPIQSLHGYFEQLISFPVVFINYSLQLFACCLS